MVLARRDVVQVNEPVRRKGGRKGGRAYLGRQLALGFKVRKHLAKQSSLSFSLLMCSGEESYGG